MSGTMMDDKPQASTYVEPEVSVETDSSGSAPSSLSALFAVKMNLRESPLLRVFYSVTRWLIYLAMAWIVYQVGIWFVFSLRSQVNVAVWRLMVEGSMLLAAILPGFVMALFEKRRFGDFG